MASHWAKKAIPALIEMSTATVNERRRNRSRGRGAVLLSPDRATSTPSVIALAAKQPRVNGEVQPQSLPSTTGRIARVSPVTAMAESAGRMVTVGSGRSPSLR